MVGQGRGTGSGKLTGRDRPNVKGTSLAGGKLFHSMLLLAVAATGVSCNRSNVRAEGPATLPPPLVTVAQARAQDVPRYLDEIGRNTAYESVNVTPQVGGQVIDRHFQDGENLRKGQLVFVIDPRPYKAQLDSAKANLAQAQAALELAKIQFARDQELVGTRAISKQDYDTKKNTVDVNQAQVEAAKAAIETAQINLDYCYIHSPIDGRAGARLVDVGNVVQANTTSLLSIQRIDPIYATFTITEQDLAEVQKKMSRGMLTALVRLPADSETAARPGKVEFLDNAVQNATGTVNLRATIPNADRHFWPGQFVNVRLVLDLEKGTVLVPSQATQISQQGPFVYVVKSDDTADLRPVTLGQRQGNDVVISSGLAPGERVVVAGQLLVRPGGKVHVGSSAPVTAPAGEGDGKQDSARRSAS
ncbi:MAG TPA: efflux RND transporter periplasmic adaptor subunit [Candidatus Acidoferrum sp.]|nr:efflux RND transporter periplasmic adaptor subunit [Candidatus Acidoferrum sp.]